MAKPSVVKEINFNHATGEFSWDASQDSVLYQLEYTASPYNENSQWDEALMTPVCVATFNPGEGEWAFRVKGFNDSGFGDASEVCEIYFNGNIY
jgi:hypothetical protein